MNTKETQQVTQNKKNTIMNEELDEFPSTISQLISTQLDIITLLNNQIVDLTMMSKIELGDEVIFEIKRLQSKHELLLKKLNLK